MRNFYIFGDTVLTEKGFFELFDSGGNVLPVVEISYPGIKKNAKRSFYKGETAEGIFVEKSNIDKITYVLEGDSNVLPKVISEDKWDSLPNNGIKNRYTKKVALERVMVPVSDADDWSLGFKTSETVNDYFKPINKGLIIKAFSQLRKVFVVDNVEAEIIRRIKEQSVTGTRTMFTRWNIDFLETPWDGKMKKKYDKKRNGQVYADRRGRMIPDYETIDSINIPSYSGATIIGETLEEVETILQAIVDKIIFK